MAHRHFLTATVVLFALVLTACQGAITPRSEETPCLPQIVEVTRLVHPSIEITRVVQLPTTTQEYQAPTRSTEPTVTQLSTTVQVGSSGFQMDPAYFDGFIVLTRYYTLLDHGLLEEVLPLYSSSLLRRSGGGNFETDLKSVTVISIRPYDYWRSQQDLPPQPTQENEIRYIVGTIVFHKAPAWNEGGTPMPDEQTHFVSLILEDGEWKLNEFNSSPWFQ